MTESSSDQHAFVHRPHRTLLALSFPVLVSLIAEPLTGLADAAFIARLGTVPLAGLGIGTAALSGIFWAFNFLGIGTQTEVAHADGTGARPRGRDASGLAMALGGAILLQGAAQDRRNLSSEAEWRAEEQIPENRHGSG